MGRSGSDGREYPLAFEALESRILLAGVTLITHGNSLLDTTWMSRMSDDVEASFPHGSATVYRVTVQHPLAVSVTKLHDGYAGDGEIILQLDWSEVSGGNPSWKRSVTDVALAVVPRLLDPGFLPGMGYAAASLPIHLIGHSRGGSLVSEMSRLLGEAGVWVDQMTLLDTDNGTSIDPPAQVWSNVVFADNYYQHSVAGLVYGLSRAGAFNELIGTGPGGTLPGGSAIDHMDVPLWYAGTIDPLGNVSWTGGIVMNDDTREAWYGPGEDYGQYAGWYYSRLRGGDRAGTWSLSGQSNRVCDGLSASFGGSGTRQAVNLTYATWCNIADLLPSKSQFTAGETASVTYRYQDNDSGAWVCLCLDTDQNPYDGSPIWVSQVFEARTGATVATMSQSMTLNAPPGAYYLAAAIYDGSHTRWVYDPTPIGVVAAGNHAPVVNASHPVQMGAVGINEAAGRGTLVSAILSGGDASVVTDADLGAREGIAVVAADSSHGTWQYSLDDGGSWQNIGAVSDAAALLLAADSGTRVRFIQVAGFSGLVTAGLTWRAWDLTAGVNGARVAVPTFDGTGAFSSDLGVASIPVVAPDAHEPPSPLLDIPAYAAAVVPGTPVTGLTIDRPGDVDWYRFTLPYGATGQGHIVLADITGLLRSRASLYDNPYGVALSQSDAAGDGKTVDLAFANLRAGWTYWVRVTAWLGTRGGYTLDVCPDMVPADSLEPNDSSAAATNITAAILAGNGAGSFTGLTLDRPADEDWFRVDAPSNTDGTLAAKVSGLSGGLQGLVWIYQQYSWGIAPVGVAVFASWMPGGSGQAVVYNARPDTTYFIRVDNFYLETGGYQLDVTLPLDRQEKDAYEKAGAGNGASWLATPVTLSGGQATWSNLSIYKAGCTEWFSFMPTANGDAQVRVSGVSGGLVGHIGLYDSVLGTLADLYGGIYATLFGPRATADASIADQTVTLNLTGLHAWTTYYVRVSGNGDTTGLYALGIQFTPTGSVADEVAPGVLEEP